MANITTQKDAAAGMAACVLCEECGPIQVDMKGMCISKKCMAQGHPNFQEPPPPQDPETWDGVFTQKEEPPSDLDLLDEDDEIAF